MSTSITGRVWVLTGADGALIDNIDTDMVFHNRYLHITDSAQMGQYALDNLAGWQDFSQRVQSGDIVVTGGNFGCGSSRQQAVDCFRSLGIAALIARSFGAIYFRNAVNTGWPVLSCPSLTAADLQTGDNVEIDIAAGTWRKADGTILPALGRVSDVQQDIITAGGLFALHPAAV
jgi:3-isopropylmalate/(R)-2-methylmalate dehydratase small subunit